MSKKEKEEEEKEEVDYFVLDKDDVAACFGGVTPEEAHAIMLTFTTGYKEVRSFSSSTNPTILVTAGTVSGIILNLRKRFPYGTLASAVRIRYNEVLLLAKKLG